MKKAYAALYKDGRWNVGARETGFTTEEEGNSITFYIFLDEYHSVREQIEIKFPMGEVPPRPSLRPLNCPIDGVHSKGCITT